MFVLVVVPRRSWLAAVRWRYRTADMTSGPQRTKSSSSWFSPHAGLTWRHRKWRHGGHVSLWRHRKCGMSTWLGGMVLWRQVRVSCRDWRACDVTECPRDRRADVKDSSRKVCTWLCDVTEVLNVHVTWWLGFVTSSARVVSRLTCTWRHGMSTWPPCRADVKDSSRKVCTWPCDVTGSGDERGVAVEEDVDKEDNVDDAVCDELRDVVDGLAVERRVVRHHDRRVVGQHEDEPVPRAPEPRVMKNNVLRSSGRRRAILQRYCRLSVKCLLKRRTSHARQRRFRYLNGMWNSFTLRRLIVINFPSIYKFPAP